MNVKSSLFKPEEEGVLKQLVQKHFPMQPLQEAKLLAGGLFNTTYLVSIGEQAPRKLVLRLGPVNRHLLLDFEQNLMPAEQYIDSICARRGIPASNMLVCDTSRDIIDRDYSFVEYIPSLPLSDERVPESDRPAIYRRIGEIAAQFHAVTGERFGRVSEILAGGGSESWFAFLTDEVRRNGRRAVEGGVLRTEDVAEMLRLFEQHRDLFSQVKTPRLVHADLWVGNVLVAEKQGGWQVAAVIDADRAVWGDPDFEFACQWMTGEDFFAGYRAVSGDDAFDAPGRVRKRRLYQLLFLLADAYILKNQYNDPEGFQNTRTQLFANLRELCGESA